MSINESIYKRLNAINGFNMNLFVNNYHLILNNNSINNDYEVLIKLIWIL